MKTINNIDLSILDREPTFADTVSELIRDCGLRIPSDIHSMNESDLNALFEQTIAFAKSIGVCA